MFNVYRTMEIGWNLVEMFETPQVEKDLQKQPI